LWVCVIWSTVEEWRWGRKDSGFWGRMIVTMVGGGSRKFCLFR
jgi:hypothetical protein